MKRIGVLALQGAVSEHLSRIEHLGHQAVAVTKPDQLAHIEGLILPGGESTTIYQLLETTGFISPLTQWLKQQRPVFATCAGMIILSRFSASQLEAKVVRNGFGRQIASFETRVTLQLSSGERTVPAVFIRAPYYETVGPDVQIMARYDEKIVAIETPHLIACAFHPELTPDTQLLAYFIDIKVSALS